VIYDRPEEPMLFIDVDIDETGRYVFFQTQRSISRNELIVKDLVNPLAPELDAPARALYLGLTALYKPLGLVNATLYMLTDRDAPNRKVVAVPIDRPDPSNWKTIVPETKNAIETAQLVGGTIVVTALVDVAGDVRSIISMERRRGGSPLPVSGRSRVRSDAMDDQRSSTRLRRRCTPSPYSVSTSPPATAVRSRRRR
jgi:prolyl oligopeptidase